ncbi:MAG: hypothetical protein EZS28_028714 [Streblomastix strix]|uniref:DDE-1 domain-containing protein n=1 Tax=Streblomastix strix TaxID=222440 RepID=A0A5J4UZ40_9EUKA|nr:MAG: hypothetical protein EZS28_028714 [Streblomastix strix]
MENHRFLNFCTLSLWHAYLVERHSQDLVIKEESPRTAQRMRVSEEAMQTHLNNLRTHADGKPVEIFINSDEIDIQAYCDCRNQCVIVPKQYEHSDIHFPIDRTEPRVSAMVGVSMNGICLRPFLITKEEFSTVYMMKQHIIQDQNVTVVRGETNMMNSELMVRLSTRAEAVLMVDNATQHCTIAIKELLKANHIILLTMPPNSTHLLQPCDVGIFGTLKLAYQQGHHGIATLTTEQIFSHIVDAIQKAARLLSITNSFKAYCLGTRISKENLVVNVETNIFNQILQQVRTDNSGVSERVLLPGQRIRKVKFGALNP